MKYDRDECFFVKEDIPEEKRKIHQEIKEMIDPDYLGMAKKRWNLSTSVPQNRNADQDHQRRLLNVVSD